MGGPTCSPVLALVFLVVWLATKPRKRAQFGAVDSLVIASDQSSGNTANNAGFTDIPGGGN
jgi:hypothetical protein